MESATKKEKSDKDLNQNNAEEKKVESPKTNMSNLNNNNLNNTPSSNTQIEFNKLQGFDVLEKIPDKTFIDNYNQEFYNTLNNEKYLTLSIPDEDKLFYHFEMNENASVSASAGQVLKSFMELFMNKMTVRKTLRNVKKEFKTMLGEFNSIDINIIEEIRPEIVKIEKRLQNFLVDQKTETIRLIKEIANLQKEKEKIKQNIKECYDRLIKLESVVGTNKDYLKTTSDAKLVGGKNNIDEKKKKKSNIAGNYNENQDNKNDTNRGNWNMNSKVTGNTITSPGEGLTENFNVNTVGSNNI